MPDGRVITAGSNPARKTEELRIEVYLAAVLVRRTPAHLCPGGTEAAYGVPLAAAVPDADRSRPPA